MSDLDINSGAMNVVMNYYRHINRAEIQFDFGYFFNVKGTFEQEIHELGGNTYFLGKPSFLFGYQSFLDIFFSKHKDEYIAVHCHPIWAAEIFALKAKKYGIKHIIQHSHSTRLGNNIISIIRNKALIFWIDYFATDFAACSEETAKLFGKKVKAEIFHNAIDCKKFSYNRLERNRIRKEFGILDNEILAGHIGRFSPEKNQNFLVSLIKNSKNIEKKFKLMLIGDGPQKEMIEKEIEEDIALSERIILTGKRTDIPAMLSAIDVFILPSKYEGVPFAAVEAQMAGLPCIISNTVTKCIKTELTTYLPLSNDYENWINAILAAAEYKVNRNDQTQIIALGYDITLEASKMEKYYRELSI